ncbi:hypothetical protein LTR36_008098 [Oleoguttula mirabilis]|uniref:Uncharacterized protein n=1 Tax=Oleoguttula mirabilis TaxID=1507867 RepID=A0AAV9J8G6_9PEZI|nr:hypothetical protein LTR36_008098 [Oleoguttula mirabilis]
MAGQRRDEQARRGAVRYAAANGNLTKRSSSKIFAPNHSNVKKRPAPVADGSSSERGGEWSDGCRGGTSESQALLQPQRGTKSHPSSANSDSDDVRDQNNARNSIDISTPHVPKGHMGNSRGNLRMAIKQVDDEIETLCAQSRHLLPYGTMPQPSLMLRGAEVHRAQLVDRLAWVLDVRGPDRYNRYTELLIDWNPLDACQIAVVVLMLNIREWKQDPDHYQPHRQPRHIKSYVLDGAEEQHRELQDRVASLKRKSQDMMPPAHDLADESEQDILDGHLTALRILGCQHPRMSLSLAQHAVQYGPATGHYKDSESGFPAVFDMAELNDDEYEPPETMSFLV